MKRMTVVIACLLVETCRFANAGEMLPRFAKEVAAASQSGDALVAVRLDAEVFANTQKGLADLRVQDPQGTSIPFIVRKSQDVQTQSIRRKTWTVPQPVLRPLEGGGLEITLKLQADDPEPNGLSLITPLRNFEQRVRVLTSSDGLKWKSPSDETVVFDYSRYMDVRNDSVRFSPTSSKHVRIVIDDVTSEQQSELLELTRHLRNHEEIERTERVAIDRRPFRIDRIEFWQEASQDRVTGDRKQNYPVADFQVSENQTTRQTIVLIETRREPLTSLQLQTSTRNFSRKVAVEIQEQHGVQSSWRPLAEATLSRIDFKTLKREQLKISFPETRSAQYRLVIDNEDSSPLNVTGLQAEGDVYEVVFLSTTDNAHRLVYGDVDATRPNFDTATIQTLLTGHHAPEIAKLGSEQTVVTGPAKFNWSHVVNDPKLLTVIIGLLVVILGRGLYSAVKQMDRSPPPQ